MSFSQLLSAYINLNMLIIAGSLCLVIYQTSAGLAKRSIGARALLRLHYISLSLLFLILLSYPMLPERKIADPSIKIWSAQSINTLSREYSPHDNTGYMEIPGPTGADSFSAEDIELFGAIILCTLLLFGLVKAGADLYRLYAIRKGEQA